MIKGKWLFHPVKQVSWVVLDFEPFEQVEVFVFEGLAGMVLFLMLDVVVYGFYL